MQEQEIALVLIAVLASFMAIYLWEEVLESRKQRNAFVIIILFLMLLVPMLGVDGHLKPAVVTFGILFLISVLVKNWNAVSGYLSMFLKILQNFLSAQIVGEIIVLILIWCVTAIAVLVIIKGPPEEKGPCEALEIASKDVHNEKFLPRQGKGVLPEKGNIEEDTTKLAVSSVPEAPHMKSDSTTQGGSSKGHNYKSNNNDFNIWFNNFLQEESAWVQSHQPK